MLFKNIVLVFLDVLQLAFLARAILSWFNRGEAGTVYSFFVFVTEPFLLPIRRLCERMRWFEGSMLDFPFLLGIFVLMLLQTLLTAL